MSGRVLCADFIEQRFDSMKIESCLHFIDKVSTWTGQAFSWLIVVLTMLVSWEVFSRYALNNPHAWAFDAMIMIYGTLFMMAGAYTLSKDAHVRGDVIYSFFRPRTQATIDLILYIVFFIPGVMALVWAGYYYAAESWAIGERSSVMYEVPPVFPFKTVIPVAGGFLLVQGVAEIIRCGICLGRGEWPPRAKDVKEVDIEELSEMVHLKDRDSAKADEIVTRRESVK